MASIDSLLKRAAVLKRRERRRGRRVQPRLRLSQIGVTSLGGPLAVGLLALLSAWSGHVLIVAPVGASCVLLFGYPRSPLAQPRLFFGRGWPFLLFPVLTGSVLLVVLAWGVSAPGSQGLKQPIPS
jgi:CBS-domain-containing membrane protein